MKTTKLTKTVRLALVIIAIRIARSMVLPQALPYC